MAGDSDGIGLLVCWTGVMSKGLDEGLLGLCVAGTMLNLGGNTVGVSFGILGKGAGQYIWITTVGEGCGAFRSGAVGGLTVTLEKIRESVWMAAN